MQHCTSSRIKASAKAIHPSDEYSLEAYAATIRSKDVAQTSRAAVQAHLQERTGGFAMQEGQRGHATLLHYVLICNVGFPHVLENLVAVYGSLSQCCQ